MSLKKSQIYALAVVVVLAVVIVGYFIVGASSPAVVAGDTIEVNYTGSFTNGTVFGTSQGGQPLQFTVGAGQLIPGFDQAVVGMKLHQSKTVTLPPNEAYGSVNPALIVHPPRSLAGNQIVQVGMVVTENISGQPTQGVVTALNATNITLDFNSPLAGKTLVFNITIVGIQQKV